MKKLVQGAFGVFLFFLILWIAGFAAFSVRVQGFYFTGKTSADAIIVLTGGPDRINAGIDLLSNGRAGHLFISGVNAKVTAAQLLALWRESRSSAPEEDPCCIVIGHDALNTSGNAAEARAWMQENNVRSAILITADYHMPRAWLEFTSLMPRNEFYANAIVSKKTNRLLLFKEYNKTLYTFMRLRFPAAQS